MEEPSAGRPPQHSPPLRRPPSMKRSASAKAKEKKAAKTKGEIESAEERKQRIRAWLKRAQEAGVFKSNPIPAGAPPPTAPCPHPDSGVSIEWLRLLEKSLRDYPRPFVDTADVVKCLLQAARTEYPSCTLLDLIPTEFIGLPSLYVSHSWKGCFFTMVQALETDFMSKWRNHRGFLIEGARIKDTISTDPKIQLLVNEEARERYEESRLASKKHATVRAMSNVKIGSGSSKFAVAVAHTNFKKEPIHSRLAVALDIAQLQQQKEEQARLDAEEAARKKIEESQRPKKTLAEQPLQARTSLVTQASLQARNSLVSNAASSAVASIAPAAESQPEQVTSLPPLTTYTSPADTRGQPPQRPKSGVARALPPIPSPTTAGDRPFISSDDEVEWGSPPADTAAAAARRRARQAAAHDAQFRPRSVAEANTPSGMAHYSTEARQGEVDNWNDVRALSPKNNRRVDVIGSDHEHTQGSPSPPRQRTKGRPSPKHAKGIPPKPVPDTSKRPCGGAAGFLNRKQQEDNILLGAMDRRKARQEAAGQESEQQEKHVAFTGTVLTTQLANARYMQGRRKAHTPVIEEEPEPVKEPKRKSGKVLECMSVPWEEWQNQKQKLVKLVATEVSGGGGQDQEQQQPSVKWGDADDSQHKSTQPWNSKASPQLKSLIQLLPKKGNKAGAQAPAFDPSAAEGETLYSAFRKSTSKRISPELVWLRKEREQIAGFYIWMAPFSVQQSVHQEEDNLWHAKTDTIKTARTIQGIGRVCVILDVNMSVFNRTWMLYEVWSAIKRKGGVFTLNSGEPEIARPKTPPKSSSSEDEYESEVAPEEQHVAKIDLMSSKASNELHRLAVLDAWMDEVHSHKSDIASLEEVAAMIEQRLDHAQQLELQRPHLVYTIYRAFGLCFSVWVYDDGTPPLQMDMQRAIDAFQMAANLRFKTELETDEVLLETQMFGDIELYLWRMLQFWQQQVLTICDEGVWVKILKFFERMAKRSFSIRLSNNKIADLMNRVGGAFNIELLRQHCDNIKISNRVLKRKSIARNEDEESD